MPHLLQAPHNQIHGVNGPQERPQCLLPGSQDLQVQRGQG
jgi:hypothetical protein